MEQPTSDIKETKAFLKDWEVYSKFMFNPKSAENTRRMKKAFSNTVNVISKYGKDNLKVADIYKEAMSYPPSRKSWIWRDTIVIPPLAFAK